MAGFLVAVVAAWTCCWFYAAHETGVRVDAWQRAEAEQGRHWTCPARVIEGFPFAIKVACTHAAFVGRGSTGTDTASVARLSAQVDILHPRTLVVALTAPFSFHASSGPITVAARWSRLGFRVFDLPASRSFELRGSEIVVDGKSPDAGSQSGKAARLTGRFSRAGEGTGATLAFDFSVAGADAPPLNALLGNEQPTDIQLVGRIDRASVGSAATPQGLIEEWRQAGGGLVLSTAHLTHGKSAVTASGSLHLDDDHRADGHLEAQFVGLGPVLQRFGISPGLAAAGSILASLFGGGRRQAPAAPGAISLPIDLRGGHLAVGPITTSVALPALY